MHIGKYEPLLSTINRRKLTYVGHICLHDTMAKRIMQGKIEDTRGRGRPRNNWMRNINKWTKKPTCKLLRKEDDREGWRRFVVKLSELIPPTIQESWD